MWIRLRNHALRKVTGCRYEAAPDADGLPEIGGGRALRGLPVPIRRGGEVEGHRLPAARRSRTPGRPVRRSRLVAGAAGAMIGEAEQRARENGARRTRRVVVPRPGASASPEPRTYPLIRRGDMTAALRPEKKSSPRGYRRPLRRDQRRCRGGISKRNVLPRPGSLFTVTVPPWSCTMCFTIESPSPVPPFSRERALSTR
jgi:hypothetical protein